MYLETLPATVKRILGTLVDQDIYSEYWLSALRDGDATIGTDGSVKDSKGSFAVAIIARDKQLTFAGPVDCNPKLISSYRAELTAILAALYFIQTIQLFHEEPLTTAPMLHCDNKSAMRAATKMTQRGVRSHMAANIDVITKIHRIKESGIPLDTAW
eukprot:4849095-Ditylum_brightwellii.AAC.1